jgi:hypothetical protein
MNIMVLMLCTSLIAGVVKGQDTMFLFFQKKDIYYEKGNKISVLGSEDKNFSQTVFELTESKFFYIKRSLADNIPIECGQLGLYMIGDRKFLLREGPWLIHERKEKVFFGNTNEDSILPEEVEYSEDAVEFNPITDDREKKANKRKTVQSKGL